ncbi:thiamine phosphate synthase [Arthrobacter sp. CAL618]|uniref:thiamine phosphate synthase n=1 Tax=Arthrobacter sp. CAL618 TaxID=1055770 RepID=UPI0009FDCBBA|nr:thiamine phosphate synthase [Arthrobacter sp. CAL618]
MGTLALFYERDAERLGWQSSTSPCVAIGGISRVDVRSLRDAGAAGAAVVSAVCAIDDPRTAAESLKEEWCY